VINCTFTKNSAVYDGSGIYNFEGSVTVTNCIFWGSQLEDLWDDLLTVTYSCIQDDNPNDAIIYPGVGNIDDDPMFVRTPDDDDAGDLHLLSNSPCIDAGTDSTLVELPLTDPDGNMRIMGLAVDMGAYEASAQAIVLDTRSVTVPEGQTATFTVALRLDPNGIVNVNVLKDSGDLDIVVVSDQPRTFNSSNYWLPQNITLAAAEDSDFFNGVAFFEIIAPGLARTRIMAIEHDNEIVPNILFVDGSAVGDNNSSSWNNALNNLQDALSAAEQFPQIDEIRVAQGTYTPDQGINQTPGDRTATFQLVNGVAIKGGYAGLAGPDPSSRDVMLYETILSGFGNCYHVVTGSDTDNSATIDGFTITGGHASAWDWGNGAGMYNDFGSPTVTNCVFTNNHASAYGGQAFFGYEIGNIQPGMGAGMYNHQSSPILTNCTFTLNSATNSGAGMSNYYSSPTLINCTFTGNSAPLAGGMHNNRFSSPTLINCTFSQNLAYGGYGAAGVGGGMLNFDSDVTLTDCTFSENSADFGGGIYNDNGNRYEDATLKMTDCTFSGNFPDGFLVSGVHGYLQYYTKNIQIEGTILLSSNDSGGSNCRITGNGLLWIDPNSTFELNDSSISCDLSGTGIIKVDTELTIEQDAIVDMAHATDSNLNGTILCDGLLRVKDNVQLINTNIIVSRTSFEGDVDISNSVITAEAGSPYGQFFIEDSVTIANNIIHADGDRYMDLNPLAFGGLIANNRIYVTITEGVGSARGGLLELRGAPDFADTSCQPGDFFCHLSEIPDFDPNTWTIEQLKLIEGAKVNLTNRFDFGNGGFDEVLYVRELKLEPNSVLNTAFNQLYYENLTGDPNSVTNEPLLGFSLNNIACDDDNEFSTRVVHNNFIDPNPDPPDYSRTHVKRVTGESPDPAGMIRMRNLEDQDPDSETDGDLFNARAKGLFSKSNEEKILIIFQYLFETPDPTVELVIYLSDVPELSANRLEVARLANPPTGRPGSFVSERFGIFEMLVSRGNLNFIRGTRIEFELIGPHDTSILINNWDPWVECSEIYCGDVTGDTGVTVYDFLTIIGEYGQLASSTSNNNTEDEDQSLRCLDGIFSQDGFVDMTDLMAGEWLASLLNVPHYCFDVPLTALISQAASQSAAAMIQPMQMQPQSLSAPAGFDGGLLIAGKRYDPSAYDYSQAYLTSRLYGFDEDGNFTSGPFDPDNDRLNTKIIRDHDDNLYQLNITEGLVGISDSNSVIPPGTVTYASDPRYATQVQIHIGLTGQNTEWSGRPILDAAFDADGFVYIAPVVVDPDEAGTPYTAVAKLELLEGQIPPYQVLQLYDDPPLAGENQQRNGLREIELDDDGYLYVVNAHNNNESSILWVYDTTDLVDNPPYEWRLELGDPNAPTYLPAPIGMHISNNANMLYMSSSVNTPDADSTLLYGLSTNDFTIARTVQINGMGHIVDITEDPATSTIWAVGFKMPNIPQEILLSKGPFYEPYLAKIPYGTNTVTAMPLSAGTGNDLALPLSIIWTGSSTESIELDLDLDHQWMYQNVLSGTNSRLTADVLITDDLWDNSSYSYQWQIVLPSDVNIEPATLSGGGSGDQVWTFAAPGCDEPSGISDLGETFQVKVTVTGNDHGNTGSAQLGFGISLLGDVNNDTVVNVADRGITNVFWRTGSAGLFTLADCDVNCDGVVNVADRGITNAIWRGLLGSNSITNSCPLR